MAARSYDLVIVGAGSGNMLPASKLASWRIAVVEASRFDGSALGRRHVRAITLSPGYA